MVLLIVTVGFGVGKRAGVFVKTISTMIPAHKHQLQYLEEICLPYADNVVVVETPSCSKACLSCAVSEVNASPNTNRIACKENKFNLPYVPSANKLTSKEVALSATVSSNNHIMARRERLDLSLVAIWRVMLKDSYYAEMCR